MKTIAGQQRLKCSCVDIKSSLIRPEENHLLGEPGGGQGWWLPLPSRAPPWGDVRLQFHVAPSHMLMGQSAMGGGGIYPGDGWKPVIGGDFPSKKIFGNLGDGKEVKKPKLPVGWGHLDVFIPQSHLLFFSKKNSHFLVLQNMFPPTSQSHP